MLVANSIAIGRVFSLGAGVAGLAVIMFAKERSSGTAG